MHRSRFGLYARTPTKKLLHGSVAGHGPSRNFCNPSEDIRTARATDLREVCTIRRSSSARISAHRPESKRPNASANGAKAVPPP